jgi:2'-5' RNA ligase
MSVGLFLPLPKALAKEFPSLGDHDTSPTHATLLYFGDAPEDVDRFLAVIRSHLRLWPGEITATLRGLRHFDSPHQTVAYNSVRFDADVAGLRSSLISHLSDNGFPSTDMSPVHYFPHVTLAYLPPNSVGVYDGPVPEGSWTFSDVEVWGLGDDPVVLPLGDSLSGRVAARYKSKKKIETKDGGEATVYEYSDRQIANRHREKAERVEHLRNHITDLRARVKDDLTSDDPMTRLTALAVALMDHTCERVGNDDSAKNGHFGVTGWKVEHVTFRGDTATIEYVGKSGVDHTKKVDDGPTVKALREACKDRDGGDTILDTDDARVTADEVNDYLAEFDVTAKDIRGFRANDEMCKALRDERAKGPKDLPRSRKEKDKILKDEFKAALERVAETVGHEAATLRSQYLVPGLEDQYVHDGTVIKSLKTATKTDAEREDEATEKLVKPSPKAKPPRHDLRNERVEAERDPDLDTTDDDLSLNFKKVATRTLFARMAERVAARYLDAKRDRPSRKERKREEMKKREEEEDDFLKDIEGVKFTNPETKNEVGFLSLPIDEQKRIRAKWREKKRKEEKDEAEKKPEEKPEEKPEPETDAPEVTIEDSDTEAEDLERAYGEAEKKPEPDKGEGDAPAEEPSDEEAKKLEKDYSEGEKPEETPSEAEKPTSDAKPDEKAPEPEPEPELDDEGKRLMSEYEAEKARAQSELDEAKADEAEAEKDEAEAAKDSEKAEDDAESYKTPAPREILDKVTGSLSTKAKMSDAAAKEVGSVISEVTRGQPKEVVEDFLKQAPEVANGILDRVSKGDAKALNLPDDFKDAGLGKTYNAEKMVEHLSKVTEERDALQEKATEAKEKVAAAKTKVSDVAKKILDNRAEIRKCRESLRKSADETASAEQKVTDAQKEYEAADKAYRDSVSLVPDEKKIKDATRTVSRAEANIKRLKDQSYTTPEDIEEAEEELKKAQAALEGAKNPKRDPKVIEKAKAASIEALKALDSAKSDKAKVEASGKKTQETLDKATAESAKLEEAKKAAEEAVPKAEEAAKTADEAYKAKSSELNRQTAYHVGMTHYMATQTDPTVGSSDPATRRTESAKKYQNLTPEARTEGLERADAEVKRLKDEVKNAEGEEKEKLQKELAVAEAEHQAARFADIVNGEGGRDDDAAVKLIRKFGKDLGIDNPYIQTLLKVGTKGATARKAFFNLASKMSNEELSDLVGDMAGPAGDLLKSGVSSSGIRANVLQIAAITMSKGLVTDEELDELTKGVSGVLGGLSESSKGSKAKKKLKETAEGLFSWFKSTTKSLPDNLKARAEAAVGKVKSTLDDLKLNFVVPESRTSPSRVAARFLAYSTRTR